MGIFTSFATGFLEGSVQVQKEKAAAELEQQKTDAERRDKLGTIIFDLIKDGKLTGDQGAELLGRSDLTRADIAGMVNMVNDTADTTRVGNLLLPFTVDFGDEKSVFNAVNQMEQYLVSNKDSFINEVNKDNKTKLAAKAFMGSLYNQNNLFHHNKFSKTNDDGIYTSHAYRDYSQGLGNFLNVSKTLGVVETSNFATLPMNLGDMQLDENQIFIPSSFKDGSVEGVIIDAKQLQQDYNTTAEMYSTLATHHGMQQGSNQLFVNGDYLTYGEDENMTPNDFYNDPDKMRSISYGAQLVSANAQDIILLEGGASEVVMDETTAILNEVGKGSERFKYVNEDIGAMRRAAFTIIKPEAQFAGKPPNHQTNISGTQYAVDRKIDVAGFREQAAATDEAVEMLQELRTLQGTYKTTGLSSKLESFVLGVVGQAKQASDLFFNQDGVADPALFQQNLGVDLNGNAATAAGLLASAENVLGKDRIQQLSRIDALRLTLAAKMARAVDTNGRLSNQDFEIQLERLGQSGWFTTQSGAMERLDTVLSEFTNRQKEQKDMRSILAKERITVEDRRFIRATHLVNTTIRHRKRSMAMQGGLNLSQQGEGSSFSTEGLIPLQGGVFYDEGEGVVYDSNGKDVSEAYASGAYDK